MSENRSYRTLRPTVAAVDAYRAAIRRDPCAYCTAAAQNGHTLDHIAPRRGPNGTRGPNTWENLTPACEPCNQRKGNRPLIWFLVRQSRSQPQRLGCFAMNASAS